MEDKSAFDRLSEAELARHGLSYAQVQLCKRGEYDAVAGALRRGARAVLWMDLSMLPLTVVAVLMLGWTAWMIVVQVVLGVLLAAHAFIHAQRTAETVHRLTEEREASGSQRPPA